MLINVHPPTHITLYSDMYYWMNVDKLSCGSMNIDYSLFQKKRNISEVVFLLEKSVYQ